MPSRKSQSKPSIRLRGCRQHNLRSLDVDIPLGKLTVVTGPSGSGKSSLAFHTLYAEGQRRYVETFSPYVRQFFDRMDKPEADSIEGIPPAIAIEQKNHVRTTRSTIGTLTEINDYLKLLFPRLAHGFDPTTGEEIFPDSAESAAAWANENGLGQSIHITFPLALGEQADPEEVFTFLQSQGYLRILHKGNLLRTDDPIPGDFPKKLFVVDVLQDRFRLGPSSQARLHEALEAAFRLGKGTTTLHISRFDHEDALCKTFSTTWSNPATGHTLRPPTPGLFSFNSPIGACPKCRGFGRVIGLDLEKAVPDQTKSIKQGAIKPFQGDRGRECRRDLLRHCREQGVDIHTPWHELPEDIREWIFYGDMPSHSETRDMADLEELWESGGWYGVQGFFDWLETKTYKMHVRIFLARFRSYTTCPKCRGARLQPEALSFKINGKTLPDLWSMPVNILRPWFEQLSKAHEGTSTRKDTNLALILAEITSRLTYLEEVGLGYLTLNRPTRTLSGGEIERVNLTTCLGASLTGTLFVLDEPTVGLHQRDTDRLISIMLGLRDKGNTIVVVEHDASVMKAADHIIDIGPGAGQHGGNIVYQGPATGATRKHGTGTLQWLSGKRGISVPISRPARSKRKLTIHGARRHNLKDLTVSIPLNRFNCLTGVSGSGKSTLAHDVIYQNLARLLGGNPDGDASPVGSIEGWEQITGVELVDQSAVARTPRSTPAVFLGAFDPIRQLFACTPDAKAQGLNTGFFSFNSGDGRCDRCAGMGFEKIEMQFLSDLFVTCPDCDGSRYKPSTLEIQYRGKSVDDILSLTVEEAIRFYSETDSLPASHKKRHKQIIAALQPLTEVGLGYLKLGQPLNTLSGGESQRLKLCQLLQDAAGTNAGETAGKLLILDEPTTGLHFSDIAKLLKVFRNLVESGHTLLVIEHNLDVIKCADWILDLGPEAGADGGKLVAEGTPERIAKLDSATGLHLRKVLRKNPREDRESASAKTIVPPPDRGAIALRGGRHHNLKNISVDIPREQLVVISGLSGSGKSTLAFDILFAEGQRRFLESMSAYARQFADQLEKPDIDQLQGLPPTVAIEQRISQGGGKSTVATVTEVWNFIRLLYAKLGTSYCPECRVPVEKQSVAAIEKRLRSLLREGPVTLFAPVVRGRKGYHTEVAAWAERQGFDRLLVDKQIMESRDFTRLERFREHDIDVLVAEVSSVRKGSRKGLPTLDDHIARALDIGRGLIRVLTARKSFLWLSIHSSCPSCNQSFDDPDPRLFSFNSPHGWCPECRGHGQVPKRRLRLDTSRYESVLEAEIAADRMIDRMESDEIVPCPSCQGSRLNEVASNVRLDVAKQGGGGLSVADLSSFTIDKAFESFSSLSFSSQRETLIARDILPEIRQRLAFLREVGLGYLQLNRAGNTLSGGESQRIRLAAQLGSNLRGVLYVLDEPTIGLHPRDNSALLKTLGNLKNHGNSLVIVEHDEDTIASADHLIDLGPAAGRLGGEIVYQGKPPKLTSRTSRTKRKEWRSHVSPTLRALTDPISHPTKGQRRPVPKTQPMLELRGCRANNLKDTDIAIPLSRLTVLTGISGSGKSTLMHHCISVAVAATGKRTKKKDLPYRSASGFEQIKACHEVDQSPIGKTSRSCPATYVKVFDHIRELFAQLPESRVRGHSASRFSFNTEGGRCSDCKGNGRIKLEMDFLPSTWVHCETCDGMRYNEATLEIRFRGKSIGEVLQMTIDEASTFFESQPRIAAPLQLLADTGLGYLQLGQPSPTLSGGEAQRIKLVSELIKGRSLKSRLSGRKPKNLYLIEEPTVGLHHEDIRRLIDILHRLVDEEHTVVVIEHHMAIAAEADWVLDVGPEAGDGGGRIVAKGTPEKVAKSKRSATAPFLASALGPGPSS